MVTPEPAQVRIARTLAPFASGADRCAANAGDWYIAGSSVMPRVLPATTPFTKMASWPTESPETSTSSGVLEEKSLKAESC